MEKIFTSIYDYFKRRQFALFAIFITSLALFAWMAIHLKLEEDISGILPHTRQIDQLNSVFQNSKFADKLVITISKEDSSEIGTDSLIASADDFIAGMQQQLGPFVKKINGRANEDIALTMYQEIYEHLPIYLSPKDYIGIDSLITPRQLEQTLGQDYRTLSSPAGIALKNVIARDPVGISFPALQKLRGLQYDDNFELYDGYVITKNHQHLLVFLTPAFAPNNTGKNIVMLNKLDELIEAQHKKSPGLHISYFGAAAVSAGNAGQIRKDSIITLSATAIFLVAFIGFYFRKKRAPFLILVPVVYGAMFALAAVFLIKGSISVIALGTGSIILGIAINYSLHVFNHYKHTGSIREVIYDLSFPLTIGSFTTIGGFFCLEFVKSEMLKDLGFFAAFSLIGAALCSLIFLPHIIVSSKKAHQKEGKLERIVSKLVTLNPKYNRYIVLAIFLLTLVFLYSSRWVSFESDLSDMNYMPEKLKKAEKDLNSINEFSLKSVYLVSNGKNLDEALQHNEILAGKIDSLRNLHIVKKFTGISSLIISDSLQRERIAFWNNFWTPEKKLNLLNQLIKQGTLLKFKPAAFDNFKDLLNKNFEPFNSLDSSGARTILDDYINDSSIVTLVKTTPENRKKLYSIFEKEPAITVVDRQYLTDSFITIINADFTSIAIMTGLLVFVVMLITYGRIELTLVSFIPMFITWIWILGIMGMAGIKFNIINIIISALIFGLGDDYSLFIMDGLLKEYKTGKKNLDSYKSSIFLSAITTVAGLGMLIFAKHPALKSIAFISIIGIVCVVFISQILIPYFFSILITDRVKKNRYPWTFTGLIKSVFAFIYFAIGSIVLTALAFILIRLNPFNKEKGKLIYHTCLSGYCWSLIYIMGNVNKKIINPLGENFSKPGVVICNHQSFLDILSTVMLNPKLILLTNQWVWRSPVFGAVVRMADYYPVAFGAENSIEKLEERVKSGYSIVVFPEGTRSVDGNIKRFHKGAFYVAEKLNLDIIPLLIHGTGYTMTKGDFLLKDGSITLKYLPRISPADQQYGANYTERTKKIGRYFRSEFAKLRMEVEQPAWFKEQLVYNYLYKGPIIEWYMKVKIKLENNYTVFNAVLPTKGKVLDLGCGYGFMSYMLHFTSPDRYITGVDYDDEKIEVANHCFSKNDHIDFICSDLLKYEISKSDAIILSDVLHYLQPKEQEVLLKNCFYNLLPGAVLLIREGDAELSDRHRGTKLTELFSTRIFGFNKATKAGLSFVSSSFIREHALQQGLLYHEIDNAKFTSNKIFIIRKPISTVNETI